MKISVICVSKREGSIKFLNEQLDKQTFKDFEIIFANDSNDKGGFKPRQKKEGDSWNLNKSYNDCLDKAKGELLVFLQDFIWIPANGLQRFWDIYQIYPTALITGCGHKAKKGLEGISEIDDRVFGERKVSECHWSDWELNWASCPKNIMPRFDEDMDKYYGGENQIIALKAFKKGYKIYIDRLNVCIGYSQKECGGRPDDWEKCHANKGFLNNKIKQYI